MTEQLPADSRENNTGWHAEVQRAQVKQCGKEDAERFCLRQKLR